jgi:hypothetical protein
MLPSYFYSIVLFIFILVAINQNMIALCMLLLECYFQYYRENIFNSFVVVSGIMRSTDLKTASRLESLCTVLFEMWLALKLWQNLI